MYLPNPVQQSPSWDNNGHSAGYLKNSSRFSQDSDVWYLVHMNSNTPLLQSLEQSPQTPVLFCLRSLFNIILPWKQSSKWALSIMFSKQIFKCISPLFPECHALPVFSMLTFNKVYTSWSCSSLPFIYSPAVSCFGSNILQSTLFSNTLGLLMVARIPEF